MQHSRGNHSASQVYYHGITLTEGTKKLCDAERARMVRFCKNKWRETSTNDTKKDFVSYQMADVFFIEKTADGQVKFAY